MDRWKAELGRGREKRRVEESRSEKRKSQKKEDSDARKGGKVAKHCVFPMICGSGGSKSRLARAAGAEPSGQMRDEKVHAVVARSTFRSQNVQSTPASDHFWKLRCRKVHAVVARSTFRSQHVQNTTCSRHLWRFRCRFAWQAQGIVDLVRSEQNVRVLSHFQKPWQAWGIWRGSAKMHFLWQAQYKKTCSWEMLGGQGADFLRGVAFWSIRSVGLLRWFLRDRCSTSYDLASIFRGRRSTLDRWSGKIARRIGKRLSALRLTFHFWRKSCRIALFLMLSSSKIEEVSQNCFVLDVVKFKNCRRLVDLFRFWCCQRRKMKKSRRIA